MRSKKSKPPAPQAAAPETCARCGETREEHVVKDGRGFRVTHVFKFSPSPQPEGAEASEGALAIARGAFLQFEDADSEDLRYLARQLAGLLTTCPTVAHLSTPAMGEEFTPHILALLRTEREAAFRAGQESLLRKVEADIHGVKDGIVRGALGYHGTVGCECSLHKLLRVLQIQERPR